MNFYPYLHSQISVTHFFLGVWLVNIRGFGINPIISPFVNNLSHSICGREEAESLHLYLENTQT